MGVPLQLLAPAKINLHLRVGRRREDGFHPLLTWMCTVGLFDILTLEADLESPPAAERAGEPSGSFFLPDLRFDCDLPGLPRDEGNLVVRVAEAFAAEVFAPPLGGSGGVSAGAATGSTERAQGGSGAACSAGAVRVSASGMGDADRRPGPGPGVGRAVREAGTVRDAEKGAKRPVRTSDAATSLSREGHSRTGKARAVRIALAKRIPVGAGLGGGSSDAARTLVGLNRLWVAGRAADRLSGFAARFGSDVPFFVAAAFGSPSAACSGRGEVVRPIGRPAAKWAVLVLPPFALSTRDVYARFDEMGLGSDADVQREPDWRGWVEAGARELLPRLVNDLEPAAFSLSPRLGELRAEAERAVGRVVRMSGSGSSLFTLFDAGEEAAARAAAEAVASRCGARSQVVEICPPLDDDLGAG